MLVLLFSLFAFNESLMSQTYGWCIQLSNRPDRTNRQPSREHEVDNEMQFSDRQLHLTGRLSLTICTGCTVAFSDRVS